MKQSIEELLSRLQSNGQLCYVQKRNNRLERFNPEKIIRAVQKALAVTEEKPKEFAEEVCFVVLSRLSGHTIHLETIQDTVENTLMDMGLRLTAKKYILYRGQRENVRKLNFLFEISKEIIDSYIHQQDWRIRENSNTSFSLQGLNAHISAKVTAEYWLNKVFPPECGEAHRKGYIHIHDLASLSTYCVGWDLEQLLIEGFGGVPGKVESKPPKHFRTALGQLVNFFFTMQGEAAGAQAVSNFDTLLAPFIAFDKLSYYDVKQALQEFVFNVNVPTRTGFQTPFVNITFDINVPDFFKKKAVIIGGKLQNSVYEEFEKEIEMINKAFCEILLEGDAKKRPFTFPIPTINLTKNIDWYSSKNLAWWKLTSVYGSPYFSNFINSSLNIEDARSMCCRLRLDNRAVRSKLKADIDHSTSNTPQRGGIFAANPLTGSIGVVTLNLPRMAYEARTEEKFFLLLDHYIEMAINVLEIKRKLLEELTQKGLYPYTLHYLQDIYQKLGHFWNNHFSTIGIIGMNEAFQNLYHTSYFSPEGQKFALKVLQYINSVLQKVQEKTGNLYNLEATPGEGASFRLAKNDLKEYPDIFHSGSKERPYYTNSVHLPVNATDDIFELLEFQDILQQQFTGGTVIHVFLGEKIRDEITTANLIKTIAENFKIPYFSLTPTFSICPVHGYLEGEHYICPLPHSKEELEQFGTQI